MNSDILNSLFYTFSTIPQVIGAVMALFGAFLIFHSQEHKTNMNDLTHRQNFQAQTVDSIKYYSAFRQELKKRFETIRIKSIISFSIGFISIVISLIIIPFLPVLCLAISYSILVFDLFMGIGSVGIMLYIIIKEIFIN